MSNVTTAVDQLLADVEDAAERRERPWAPVAALHRAVAHIVEDKDEPGVPAPAGDLLGVQTELAGMLAEVWTTSAMSIAPAITLIDVNERMPPKHVPVMEVAPQAGPQAGQKSELPSHAFEVGSQAHTIDSAAYLNISRQLQRSGEATLIGPMLRAAAAHEASNQIGAVIVANGTAVADTAAAWAAFDSSRFRPRVLACPPSFAPGYAALDYDQVGVSIVVSSSLSKPVLLDPGAVIAYLGEMSAHAVEPSALGNQIAVAFMGTMGLEETGVAVIG